MLNPANLNPKSRPPHPAKKAAILFNLSPVNHFEKRNLEGTKKSFF